MTPVFFATADELRDWFAERHAHATELWVGFYKKGSRLTGVTYAEAVDEALCVGWIDGVRRVVDDGSYANRFTPRRPRGNWSAVNIARVGVLAAQGRLQPAGLAAFERRDDARTRLYSYEATERGLDDASAAAFRAHAAAWAFFEAQPASYRKAASWWVVSAKREETKRRRLTTLIEESAQGRRLARFARPVKRG